jgi:hypothetical protein
MACIPETAPKGENHLLQNTSDVKSISYQPDGIDYATVAPGQEILLVRDCPKAVTASGSALPRQNSRDFREDGWNYDPSGLLRVRHRAPAVVIQFTEKTP